ncbi:hypothetical protein MBLNU13_g08901t3 [Cladosporium sp. NU13]
MPLLHRRSVFDPLSSPERDTSHNRPGSNASLAPPTSPRPVSEYARPTSRPSTAMDHTDRPASPTVQPENARTKRFSMLKFRTYSESHLSARAKQDAAKEIVPPMPTLRRVNTPAIVKTAPTLDHEQITAAQTQGVPFAKSLEKTKSQASDMSRLSEDHSRVKERKSTSRWRKLQGRSTGLEDLQRLSAAHAHKGQDAPPAYGHEQDTELALPAPRFSESSRSDGSRGSSGDHQIYGSTTTTTHTVSTHTTFFKLPRRSKNRNSLFPLPVKIPSPDPSRLSDGPATPRASTSGVSIRSQQSTDSKSEPPPPATRIRRHTETSPTRRQAHQNQLASSPHTSAANSLLFSEPGQILDREETQRSRDSSFSSPLRPPMRFGLRDRAATTSSWGRGSMDTPQNGGSGRTSTSTTGRPSFGGFLGLSRFRHGSEPLSPRNGSPSSRSKSNSFAMSREALVVPEREEGDTPGKYLERLEAAVTRSMIAEILSKSSDPFAQAVLRSYTRRFPFFGEPIDMSLRKFLLEADLPKETQQVDRVIQAFADRYHECNPGIFMSSDQAYIIAFSLMMLHTDAFNRNNKRKMQKQDYIKNTSGQHVSEDVLACFYDNICYTPFVHYDEEVDINGERVLPFKSKKSKLKGAITDSGKKVSGPVDPYNLLIDQKLDLLRPPIKDLMSMEDPYNYLGSQALDMQYLQRAFTHTGTLQIISARSRPAAYEGQVNTSNPHSVETQQGIVDLKVTKVGTLWRKAAKKKKARSPWQEWGAILTGSQLYLFKNASWAKGLVHQFMSHQRQGAPRMPVIFSPPIHEFKPDALIKTDNAVALIDATYNRHKNAFTFVRPGGQEEVLLADNENELNDWLNLINYAAAFRAAGVRIRGMISGHEECNRPHLHHRPESAHSTHAPSAEERSKSPSYDIGLTRQVMAARRQIMMQKIGEYDKDIGSLQKQYDDILRNARHLLVLAPIPPKTREELVYAAEKTDSMLTWVRRDIWKMRCHRDILALDVQQDGVEVGGVQNAADKKQPDAQAETPDTAKKVIQRFGSQAGSRSPRSKPQSPDSRTKSEKSPNSMRPRPSTTESMDSFVDDVFRSTVDSPGSPGGDGWRLPPLQFNVEQQIDKHRGSVASTMLSATSGTAQRQPSWSASSTSSRQPQRLNSPNRSESLRIITPMQGTGRDDLGSRPQEEVRTPEAGITRTMNLDGVVATPESNKTAKGKRRSLQKTLREASSVSQRHRRNKESESTVRSNGDGENADPEATPGLERAQGRFILHGKQASVVQFGNDWPTERMRLRREKWHREHEQPGSPGKEDGGQPSMFPMGSPVVQDLDDGEGSTTASHDYSGAESFADASETSKEAQKDSGDGASADGFDPYDLSWDPRSEKRITVIGPKPGANIPKSPVGEGSKVDEDEEGESDYEAAKEHRRTVIAPPFVFPSVESTSEAPGQDGQGSSNTADQEQSEKVAQIAI